MLWSAVLPMVPVLVPPDAVNATVAPPVVRLFPTASFAWSVSVTVEPEATVPLDAVTTDWLVEIVPGVTVTVGSALVTATELIVALIVVADPAVTPVKVAV